MSPPKAAKRGKRNCQSSEANLPQRDSDPGPPGRQSNALTHSAIIYKYQFENEINYFTQEYICIVGCQFDSNIQCKCDYLLPDTFIWLNSAQYIENKKYTLLKFMLDLLTISSKYMPYWQNMNKQCQIEGCTLPCT